MKTFTVSGREPIIAAIVRATFPTYRGRKFRVQVSDAPINAASSWEGGSRDYFRFVNLATFDATATMPAQSAFDRPAGIGAVPMPAGFACVRHSIFCGKDTGLTIIVRPDNAAPLLPPAPDAADALTIAEAAVLIATRSLKNSYGGRANIRETEAVAEARITVADYQTARAALTRRGYLTLTGAITPAGRNALTLADLERASLYDLRGRAAAGGQS